MELVSSTVSRGTQRSKGRRIVEETHRGGLCRQHDRARIGKNPRRSNRKVLGVLTSKRPPRAGGDNNKSDGLLLQTIQAFLDSRRLSKFDLTWKGVSAWRQCRTDSKPREQTSIQN